MSRDGWNGGGEWEMAEVVDVVSAHCFDIFKWQYVLCVRFNRKMTPNRPGTGNAMSHFTRNSTIHTVAVAVAIHETNMMMMMALIIIINAHTTTTSHVHPVVNYVSVIG